jgi:hypothetical protein
VEAVDKKSRSQETAVAEGMRVAVAGWVQDSAAWEEVEVIEHREDMARIVDGALEHCGIEEA